MSTIRRVADDAGVSIATVSRVLNQQGGVRDQVRERVLTSARRCGYVKTNAKNRTAPIAFGYTGPPTLGSPFDAAVIEGIWDGMDETDLDLVMLNLARDKRPDDSFAQFFYRKGIRGIILRTTTRTRQICRDIAAEGFPALVVGDRFDDDERVSYVFGDSRPSSRRAVEHLLDLGHRRIAIAVSMIEDTDHHDRVAAFRSVMLSRGVEPDPRMILRIPASAPDGAQVLRTTLSLSDRPTAICVTDPIVAVGLINEARRIGVSVPGELSVVGFDDRDLRSHVYPTMTAVCQDARQLGHEALIGLRRLMDDPDRPIRLACGTWFEIHDTTGCPPEAASSVLQDGTRFDAASADTASPPEERKDQA